MSKFSSCQIALRALLALTVLSLASCGGCPPGNTDGGLDAGAVDDTARIYTPRWAFEPWISKDISDGPDTYAFVDGFLSRGIPVGAVVLDSPWETNYNTFEPNPNRYPNFGGMVQDLADQDIRLVLWVTQMINESSFDLEQGGDVYDGPAENLQAASLNNYLVNDATTYFWWKGYGAGIDFFNDDAMTWWHELQQPLYDMGVNGWKLDFGEEYITTDVIDTAQGEVSHQAYSEAYYQDFFEHGQRVRGREEFVTMVRPYDESYGFEGRFFARPEHAPVLWVGDQFRNWEGLSDALDHLFRSAAAGYVVIGSDIGGYLDNNVGTAIPFDVDVLFAWTAMSGFMPFFQLHGRANLEPWNIPTRTDEYVDAYRYWASLHHQMVPFYFSLAEEGYGPTRQPPFTPMVHPLGEASAWPGDYRYLLGDAFLVAPILDATLTRDVVVPAGRYVDWYALGGAPIEGGQTLVGVSPPDGRQMPAYLKQGAIVPLQIDSEATLLGPVVDANALSVVIWPAPEATSFWLHDAEAGRVEIRAEAASVTVPGLGQPWVLQIRSEGDPSEVTVAGVAVGRVADPGSLSTTTGGFTYEAARKIVWVTLPTASAARIVTLTP